jgi:UDP-N-acetylglucosamine:LPS N-acetylglucosamine transferase
MIFALAADPDGRQRMSDAARSLARPDAAQVIANKALALAGA